MPEYRIPMSEKGTRRIPLVFLVPLVVDLSDAGTDAELLRDLPYSIDICGLLGIFPWRTANKQRWRIYAYLSG